MGKILVIPNSDFSENAVRRGVVEPTEYYTLKGMGTSANFSVGDYYTNPNFPNRISRKDSSSANTPIETALFAKYINKDYYIYLNPDLEDSCKFEPNYGLRELAVEQSVEGQIATATDGVLSWVVNSGNNAYKFTLPAGASCTWVSYGSQNYGTLIAVNNGVASIISSGSAIADKTYTNESNSDITIYLNCARLWPLSWLAIIL